jgi:hypothetical protein
MVAYEFNPTFTMALSPLKMLRRHSRIAGGDLSVLSLLQSAAYGGSADSAASETTATRSIPKNCVPKFVGEGAANMVFEITLNGRPVFEGKSEAISTTNALIELQWLILEANPQANS